MKDPRSVAVVSSGDPEADQKSIRDFLVADDRIEHGLCPNGCGGMIQEDDHNARCPKCEFGYFSNAKLNFKHGEVN